jgi:stage V sporulation protein B
MHFSEAKQSNAASAGANLLGKVKQTLCRPMVGNAGILATSQCAATVLGFVTTVIAARLLGPTDYGVATIIMAYPMLLWSYVNTKSVSITTRYIAGFRAGGRKEELKSICKLGYCLDLLMSLITFGLTCATGWWVSASIYRLPEMAWLMIAYSASFPLYSLTGTSFAILSSWQHFRLLACFQVLDKGITSIVVVSFLLTGFGVPGMVAGTAVIPAAIGLAMMGAASVST